jgi:hypothetical protein
MDESGVQEDRDNETEPLVRLVLELIEWFGLVSREDGVLLFGHVESAKLGKCAVLIVVGSCIWTRP